jgi:dTDP-4-dehydrorhamnose reductase
VEPERAFAVNATAVRRLAQACARLGALLVHISTDYVFDGAKGTPYVEEDAPCPLSVYAASKLAGEYLARAVAPRHAVVRTCGLYGATPCRAKAGLNFPRAMLKLAREKGEVRVVTDEFVTPTYTVDLAGQLVRIVDAGATGLFHATPQGQCSWYEFAAAVFELTGTPVRLHKAVVADFPPKVRRPSYSVLENAHLKRLGLDVMPEWRTSLERYVRDSGGQL